MNNQLMTARTLSRIGGWWVGDLETLYFQYFINGTHTPNVKSAHFLLNIKIAVKLWHFSKIKAISDQIHSGLKQNATVHIPNNGIAFLIQCLIADESQTADIVMSKYSIVLN